MDYAAAEVARYLGGTTVGALRAAYSESPPGIEKYLKVHPETTSPLFPLDFDPREKGIYSVLKDICAVKN